MTVKKDLRETPATIEECDQLHARLADCSVELELLRAKAEKEIEIIKTQLDADTHLLRQEKHDLEYRIVSYVEQNKDQFQKPRKHKTSYGSYGLTKDTKVDVFSEEECAGYCADHGLMDCIRITTKTIRSAISKRLKKGESIPGVRILEGDMAVVNIDKAILEEAVS